MSAVHIRGLIRAVRYVQNRMSRRLVKEDADRLASYVRSVVHEVENICRGYGVTPGALPRPSREAFEFLLDLNDAGIERVDSPLSASRTTIRTPSVLRMTNALLRTISSAAFAPPSSSFVENSIGMAFNIARKIEASCARQGGLPCQLPRPSRNAYGLLCYLASQDFMAQYVGTVASLAAIAGEIAPTASRSGFPLIILLDDHSHVYRYRRSRSEASELRLSPVFIGAPDNVLRAVTRSALIGGQTEDKAAIHLFMHGESAFEVVQQIADFASTPPETRGIVYDLSEVCERVRNQYFAEPAHPPASLGWTDTLTYRMFGLYSSVRDRITISRSLDSRHVPQYVIDYVMFHELLHKAHGIGWATKQRTMHTTIFRRDERSFPHYRAAQEFLGKLSRQLRRRLK